jgi:hypothetical protein
MPGMLEQTFLTIDSRMLYTESYERGIQEQPERVLGLPLSCGLVSEISPEGAPSAD